MSHCSCPHLRQYGFVVLTKREERPTIEYYSDDKCLELQLSTTQIEHDYHQVVVYGEDTIDLIGQFLRQITVKQREIEENMDRMRQQREASNEPGAIHVSKFIQFLDKTIKNEEGESQLLAKKLIAVLLACDLFMLMISLITLVLQTVYTAQNWRFIMDANRDRAWAFMVFYFAFYLIVPIAAEIYQCNRTASQPHNHPISCPTSHPANQPASQSVIQPPSQQSATEPKGCKMMMIGFITHMLAFFVNGVILLHTLHHFGQKLFPSINCRRIPQMKKLQCPIFFIYGLKNLLFIACFLTFIVEERFNYTASSGSTSNTLVFAFSMAEMAVWGLADLRYEFNLKLSGLFKQQSEKQEDEIQPKGRVNANANV